MFNCDECDGTIQDCLFKNCQFAYIVLVSEQLTKKHTSAFIGASLTPSQSTLLKRFAGVAANDNYMVVVAVTWSCCVARCEFKGCCKAQF